MVRDGGGRGSGQVRHQRLPSPPPPPHVQKKFSLDFYILHGTHWAAEGDPDPRTSPASYAAVHMYRYQIVVALL